MKNFLLNFSAIVIENSAEFERFAQQGKRNYRIYNIIKINKRGVAMKMVLNDSKAGKSYNVDLGKEKETLLVGKKIGEKLDGSVIGAAGYSFTLTGGSDKSGFPMRPDITGSRKMRVLISNGIGFHAKDKGARRRKLVQGNTISGEISQINAKVTDYGTTPLEQLFPPAKKEEKK